tara:strand:+ start:196 stop:402 length:207 start_codon:yes stop_codon:yes gene_type:complete
LGVIYKNEGILLEAIFVESYSIAFGDGLLNAKILSFTEKSKMNPPLSRKKSNTSFFFRSAIDINAHLT